MSETNKSHKELYARHLYTNETGRVVYDGTSNPEGKMKIEYKVGLKIYTVEDQESKFILINRDNGNR